MKHTGALGKMTKRVLSYQGEAATKHVSSEQQHSEGRPVLHRVDRGGWGRGDLAAGRNAGQKVWKFAA